MRKHLAEHAASQNVIAASGAEPRRRKGNMRGSAQLWMEASGVGCSMAACPRLNTRWITPVTKVSAFVAMCINARRCMKHVHGTLVVRGLREVLAEVDGASGARCAQII